MTGTAPTETVEIEGFGPVTVRGLSKDRIKQISGQAGQMLSPFFCQDADPQIRA